MHLLNALAETALGRALVAYFFDLSLWLLANILFAVSLLPAYLLLSTQGLSLIVMVATLPAVPILAGMINLAASQTAENVPRLRNALTYPATLFTVFALWAGGIISTTLVLIFLIGILLLALFIVGVFALFMPSQLKVGGLLIWRNALVLGVSYPVIGLGLLMLGGIGIWAVVISKGALIIVIPSLWVVLAAFTVDERIQMLRTEHQAG